MVSKAVGFYGNCSDCVNYKLECRLPILLFPRFLEVNFFIQFLRMNNNNTKTLLST